MEKEKKENKLKKLWSNLFKKKTQENKEEIKEVELIEEVLEKYPSGAVKITITRNGTPQGHDIINKYHQKGKLQETRYKYNSSDGLELDVTEVDGNYIVKYLGELHNPDGPAIFTCRAGKGRNSTKGWIYEWNTYTLSYFIHGKRIEDGPADISFSACQVPNSQAASIKKESWYKDGILIRKIDRNAGKRVDKFYVDGKLNKMLFSGGPKLDMEGIVSRVIYNGEDVRVEINPDSYEEEEVKRLLEEKYFLLGIENRKVEYSKPKHLPVLLFHEGGRNFGHQHFE